MRSPVSMLSRTDDVIDLDVVAIGEDVARMPEALAALNGFLPPGNSALADVILAIVVPGIAACIGNGEGAGTCRSAQRLISFERVKCPLRDVHLLPRRGMVSIAA